jgi:pimeloyl-ACP methyl ester carboxylesterase
VIGALMAMSSVAMAEDLPRYESGKCLFEGADELGARVACGTLVVHEDHAKADGRVVNVAVAVVKASGPNVHRDPLVYLSGGPGEPGTGSVTRWLEHPVAQSRDIILVDQRGTGRSDPLCPDLAKELIGVMADDLTPEQDVARNREAAGDCLKSLRDRGVEPSAYGSAATAADLEALRKLLGYDEWNLLGVSYGTRLALTAMRDFPEGIRSVVLDSPFAPHDDFYESMRDAFPPALERLAADCDDDANCKRGGSDVKTEISALLDAIEQKPLVVRIDDPELLPDGKFVVNRQDMHMLLGFQIRDAGVRAVLPAFVRAWRQGNTESLALLIKIFAHMYRSVDVGKHYAVQCYEEMPFSALRDGHHEGAASAFLDAAAAVCADWKLPLADARENEPVPSAIPTLLLSGELDFGTSTANARRTATFLSNGTVIEVPGAGHSVGGHGCVADVVASFLDGPDRPPDASCMAAHPTPPPMGALRLSGGPLHLFRGLQGSQPLGILWLTVTLLMLALAAVIWPIRGLWRWRRRRAVGSDSAKPSSKRRLKTIAHASLGLAAVTAWVFIVGLADTIAGMMGGDYAIAVLAGLPSDTSGLFMLPKATALLVCCGITAMVLSWRGTSWSKLERIHYLVTCVSGIALLVFLGTYELF